MSNIHTLQKIFPAGFDNGYGSLKLLVDGFEVGGKIGDASKIRFCLEMGHTKYSRDIDIKDIYSACLKDWYEKYLKKVVNLTLDRQAPRG